MSYVPSGQTTPVSLGTVTGMYTNNQNQVIGVQLNKPLPSGATSNLVYTFSEEPNDYAGSKIASLFYTWANYYATTIGPPATAATNVGGTINGNILTQSTAARTGLVPGMPITVSGVGGVPGTTA